MNLRRLLVVSLLAWAGCSGGKDMDDWSCLSTCDTVVFALPRPLSGPEISFVVTEPDGTVDRLDCQPSGGSLACLPLSSPLAPSFDTSGALESVSLGSAARGAYTVDVIIDGTRMAGGTFQYTGGMVVTDPCGGGSICTGPQSFTVGT